ncbi:hypothetical protein [Nocardiopsis tropica]|uniref:Uncharacterized protein n=1 Tax=Nocardiopsis tropica TaxID=109330 RepID=A0ABU7KIK9_9ACTN|nr:hypothetical protein [Nocardiopsis umidischolae]MEE2049129.1 hypothetical protein [Nocardiopsis umidischolae]
MSSPPSPPPAPHGTGGPPARPPQAGPASPEPALRPGKHWYWVGGLLFPATLVFGVLLLSGEEDTPPEIFFGIVTPVLGFIASLVVLLVVFLVRAGREAALRRARYPRPYPPQGAGPHGGPAAHGAYGAGPVHAGPLPPPFRPRIDRGAIRPRPRWFWIGGLCVPGGVAAGALAMWAMTAPGSALPDFAGQVESRGEIAFEVAEGEDGAWGLWVSPGDASHHYDCELEGSSAADYPFSFPGLSYESDGWKLVDAIDTPVPGEYTLVCDGDPGVSYAVGDIATAEAAHSRRDSGLGALALLSLAGVVAGPAVIVVTAVRRGRSEARLREEAGREADAASDGGPGPGPAAPTGPPSGPPPGPPSGPPPGPPPGPPSGPAAGGGGADPRYRDHGITIVPPEAGDRPRPE